MTGKPVYFPFKWRHIWKGEAKYVGCTHERSLKYSLSMLNSCTEAFPSLEKLGLSLEAISVQRDIEMNFHNQC